MEPFGSFVSNLFTTSGDLDISVHLSNTAYITFTGKKHKQKLLQDLLGALRNGNLFSTFSFSISKHLYRYLLTCIQVIPKQF